MIRIRRGDEVRTRIQWQMLSLNPQVVPNAVVQGVMKASRKNKEYTISDIDQFLHFNWFPSRLRVFMALSGQDKGEAEIKLFTHFRHLFNYLATSYFGHSRTRKRHSGPERVTRGSQALSYNPGLQGGPYEIPCKSRGSPNRSLHGAESEKARLVLALIINCFT